MLCTLLKPTDGRALVAGHDVVASPGEVRIRIGVALQEAALDDRQTGREILDLQARLYGLSPADRKASIGRAVDLADIGDAMDERVATYSGGMKRRLDLAASLIHGPEVIFLDEPTTGLDPVSRAQVWDEVRRLNREFGVTVFLTTQYMEEADALAERGGHHRRGPHRRAGRPRRFEAGRRRGRDRGGAGTRGHRRRRVSRGGPFPGSMRSPGAVGESPSPPPTAPPWSEAWPSPCPRQAWPSSPSPCARHRLTTCSCEPPAIACRRPTPTTAAAGPAQRDHQPVPRPVPRPPPRPPPPVPRNPIGGRHEPRREPIARGHTEPGPARGRHGPAGRDNHRHRHRGPPGGAQPAAGAGVPVPRADHPAVLLRGEHRRAAIIRRENAGHRLQGVPAAGGHRVRGHRHHPSLGAGDRHPDRLPRPDAGDARAAGHAAARHDGRRHRAGHRLVDRRSSAWASPSACASTPAWAACSCSWRWRCRGAWRSPGSRTRSPCAPGTRPRSTPRS